jgi:hypothetical protein
MQNTENIKAVDTPAGTTPADIHSCSYYCDRPECVKAQRDELRARVDELEQDAARYRFLRKYPIDSYIACGYDSYLDAAIDSAMKG